MHFSPPPYLDPGSGSILVQMLIASILGAGIFIRIQWARIKTWFGIKPQDEETDEDDKPNA